MGHIFSSKEQAPFNFMAAVTICSDSGAQESKIMQYGFSLITSWQIDGEIVETVAEFMFWGGSKITADGDCSHEIKDACSLKEKL